MSLSCCAYFQTECCNENFQGCCVLKEYLESWFTHYTKMPNVRLQVAQQSQSYLLKISAVLAEINHIVCFAIPSINILFPLCLHSILYLSPHFIREINILPKLSWRHVRLSHNISFNGCS